MSAEVVYLRDYHLRRVEKQAAQLLGELVTFAKEGGPIVKGSVPVTDPWAAKHYPGGIDDLDLA